MAELADLLQPARSSSDSRSAVIEPDFLQGRTAFGGLVAALCARAAHPAIDAGRPLRSMMLSLVAPIAPGQIAIEPVLLRQGKAASHIQVTVTQDGSVKAVALGAFGAARKSSLRRSPPRAPTVPPPDAQEAAPFIPGLTPEFSKFFEYRWPPDAMPFTGQGKGVMQGWLRLRTNIEASEPFLVALGDSWPSPALPMLTRPEVFATLSWSLELTGAKIDQSADAWWLASAAVEQAGDGYVRQQTNYFDQSGALVLVSRQVVAVFAPGL